MDKWWEDELTELKGELIKPPPLIFYIGREFRLFRILYWRITKKYWWGIHQALVDLYRR